MNMIQKLSFDEIRQTEGQTKKHIKQMNSQEITYLKERIQKINTNTIRTSLHLKQKLGNEIEGLDLDKDIKDALTNTYEILEYNYTKNNNIEDKRVLIRSSIAKSMTFRRDNKTIIGKGNICIVLSILDNRVITAYYNRANDGHRTLDMKRYDKTLKII